MSLRDAPAGAGAGGEFGTERARMVAEIADMARQTGQETGRPRFADGVMDAMRAVPRHLFVPRERADSAYRNHPLPIGSGQTISQPFIVALTTDLIEPRKHHRVLEIGTGSGYQAAVLAELVHAVDTVEIIEPLAREAAQRLRTLGYHNVSVHVGDGHAGWPARAPYDGIVVTAAASHVPSALVAQLKPGARMVIPVGPQHSTQEFTLVEKRADGGIVTRVVLPVRFVPMTGGS
ncbi:MAG: protein-L-isoaspartate(D-aspartate) O-methyltransferase [Burkholderiales bacterium]|nr:protein-L-isoaspartate(D-aspartate) O-methyltransferase [Burkholderiales bacterium]